MMRPERPSENFIWDEVVTTENRLIDNSLPEHLEANAIHCAERWEVIRKLGGNKPIYPTSWFRCEELNTAIGGSPTSDHMQALAIDGTHHVLSVTDFFILIYMNREMVRYRQLIWEFGRWVHCSFNPPGVSPGTPQTLVIKTRGNYLPYHPGMKFFS